jgi:hypothetical protein
MRGKIETSNSNLEDKLNNLQASYNMLYEKKEEVDKNLQREIRDIQEERRKMQKEIMRLCKAKDEEEIKYKQQILMLERKVEEYKPQLYQAREEEIRYKNQISILEERLKVVEADCYQSKREGCITIQQEETRSTDSFQTRIQSNYERFNEMLEENPALVLLAISLMILLSMQAFYYIIHSYKA